MFRASSWPKLSIATTTLGLAILATFNSLPTNAVQLRTFKITGTFGDERFETNGGPTGGGGYLNLANGYFEGTYTVDVDQLPVQGANSKLDFVTWDVKLYNSSGVIRESYIPNDEIPAEFTRGFFNADVSSDRINFFNYKFNELDLYVDSNFQGTSTGRAVDVGLPSPVYGVLGSYYGLEPQEYPLLYVTSFRSTPVDETAPQTVPEPATLTGVLATFALGWLAKRKQKAILISHHY
jgi:hypothetical protein